MVQSKGIVEVLQSRPETVPIAVPCHVRHLNWAPNLTGAFECIDIGAEWRKNDGEKANRNHWEGTVRYASKVQFLSAFVLLAFGLVLAGCKTAPQLTREQALSIIQAKYDSTPPAPANISVNDLGMQEGVTAKYWVGLKRYPNGYWGDFKLTPEGKKVVTLVDGGDVIQWRPEQQQDPKYTIALQTTSANHLKAREIRDIEDDGNGGKTVTYTEDAVLAGVPDPLQGIAHNPGNRLSTQRTASFTLKDGSWALQSIE
jgi:hypothetical protein